MDKYMVGAPMQGTSKVRDDVQGARSSQSGLDSLLLPSLIPLNNTYV
jgi:hypothetical protein